MKAATKAEVIHKYQDRVQKFEGELNINQKLSSRYSYIRLAIFLLSIPAIYFLTSTNVLVLIIGILTIAILFVQAVLRQQKYDELVRKAENLVTINRNEIENLSSFSNIYYNGSQYKEAHHYYSDDLDIFGENSLFSLINRANTYEGVENLSSMLLRKPSKDDILARQQAVKEVEAKLDWRQNFASTLLDITGGYSRNLAQEIDEELSLDLRFAKQKILNYYRKALPLVWLGAIALYFYDTTLANSVGSIIFFFNLALAIRRAKEISSIQAHLANASTILRSYEDAIEEIFSSSWDAEIIKSECEELKDRNEKHNTSEAIRQLKVIIDHLDYRLNFIVAILLNGLVLWDYRVIHKLARWKALYTGALKDLFTFVGKMEGLSSLATYAYNHPAYNYPLIIDDYFSLNAIQIKHPLIHDKDNIANDFSIKNGQHLSIITGSNMSGKSTLLRTIGINMILGFTGTRVAAQEFQFPIVTLISYMRIKDILEENVSTFKAELNRIQLILQQLKSDPYCFILIDEMLRGTNSKDKLTGSIGIAKRLLAEKTYAMIATHDIKLAELSNDYDTGIANYYFDIDYEDGDLVFDYKVKDGICENFNASFLLNRLGIEME